MSPKPKHGEIWLVNFEPQIGAEIFKTRPALVVSIDVMGSLPLRIVVPVREFKKHHTGFFYLIPIIPTKKNGLGKESTIDCAQIKSFDLSRFKDKLGKIEGEELKEVITTLAKCIGYV